VTPIRTPENIKQHEIIGLECEIRKTQNKSQIGIHGRIIDETMKTVLLERDGERKRIQKKGTIFRLALGEKKVDVDGNFMIARPEDRIKRKTKRW